MGEMADYYRDLGDEWEQENLPQHLEIPDKTYYHKTKDGTEIAIHDLEMSHLVNIIKYIERRAEEGVRVFMAGGCPTDPSTFWYDEEYLFDKKAKERLHYDVYVKEYKLRTL